jgi:hypothetical protein
VLAPLERRALLTPEQGAQTTLHCVVTPDLVPGGYYQRCEPAEPSADAQDRATAKELWDCTAAWLEGLPAAP